MLFEYNLSKCAFLENSMEKNPTISIISNLQAIE